jgi:hypothetical protein
MLGNVDLNIVNIHPARQPCNRVGKLEAKWAGHAFEAERGQKARPDPDPTASPRSKGWLPRRLIGQAIEGEAVELFSSPVLLDELAHTLGYSKFAACIESFATSVAALVAQYTALVSLVMPASVPRVVPNDADDDHVIAAAVAARAELNRHRGSQAPAAHRNPSGHRHRHRA